MVRLIGSHYSARLGSGRWLGLPLIAAVAVAFAVLYAETFRGSILHRLTHGPFNFECGIYRSYAVGEKDLATTDNDKLVKHFLCAVLYPILHNLLMRYFPVEDSPLVCSFLSGLMLALFGFWLYRRTGCSPLAIIALLLFGFSFTTWYDGSVWESRSFIGLGGVVLLVSLDWVLRRPSPFSAAGSALALIFLLLINVGNAYLIPLLPLALLLGARRAGWGNSLYWSRVAVFSVLASIAVTYQVCGIFLNPRLQPKELWARSRHDQAHIQASAERFTAANYGRVALQSLVSSVGGLRLPTGYGRHPGNEVWTVADSYQEYFGRPSGILFVAGWAVALGLALVSVLRQGLFLKEPLLLVIVCWIVLYISFFVYFNPDAGPVYAAELMAPLWAFIALALLPLGAVRSAAFLGALAIVLAWNNRTVIRFFRDFYQDPRLATTLVNRIGTGYQAWAWEIKPSAAPGARTRVKAAHAVPGEPGGFRIAVWEDRDRDGVPDREIAGSPFLTGTRALSISAFEFNLPPGRVFVGLAWPPERNPWVFFDSGLWPPGSALQGGVYLQRAEGKFAPLVATVTNLWVSFPNGEAAEPAPAKNGSEGH